MEALWSRTTWPSGVDSPGRCSRVGLSCPPRRSEPWVGWESLGPSDSDAPGTSCGRMPSFLPEGKTDRGEAKFTDTKSNTTLLLVITGMIWWWLCTGTTRSRQRAETNTTCLRRAFLSTRVRNTCWPLITPSSTFSASFPNMVHLSL